MLFVRAREGRAYTYISFAPTWGIYFVLRFTYGYVIAMYVLNGQACRHIDDQFFNMVNKTDDSVMFSMRIISYFSLPKTIGILQKRHTYDMM